MVSVMDYAFPAGEESEASSDEWDMGFSEKKHRRVKDPDVAVPVDQDNASLLKRAITEGDIEAVEQLLDNGMSADTRLAFDWTPLMCAVSVANYDLAKMLLDRGANANFSKDHHTVLMASCMASAKEDKIARCMELLLSRNADPNVTDRSQVTCMMLASREGYSKVINLLASYGAEINIQNDEGYTALTNAVQYGREEAVLKLLQLGADKSIMTKTGKSAADLATIFKHAQISKILASSQHTSSDYTFNTKPRVITNKLDELELFLHGLNLSYLTDIMSEHDITWTGLLTMDEDDLKQIGVTDPEDRQKLLSAVKKMILHKVDVASLQAAGNSGNEELLEFLISLKKQCVYLTETIQDTVTRFPCRASQLVFSLDPNNEAQAMCNQIVIQIKDMQKEVTFLRNLLCQLDQAEDCFALEQPVSHTDRKMQILTRVALSVLGTGIVLLSRKVYLQLCRSVC